MEILPQDQASPAAAVPGEPMKFTGKLLAQDVIDLDRYRLRHLVRRPVRVLAGVAPLCVAALVVLGCIHTGFTPFSVGILVLCTYVPFGWWLLRPTTVARYYRRHAKEYQEWTTTISKEAILLSSADGEMSVRYAWNRLESVSATPRGLLFLVPPTSVWFWLPQRVFEGNAYRAAILALAAEHRVPVRRLT